MKFVLICATGRSGSTTLQRIINTIEDSNINGENCGAISDLLQCYSNIKKTNKLKLNNYIEGKTEKKPCWYNCYDFENVKENIKNTILSIITNNNSKKVVGFKEIRWVRRDMHLIDEFIELFPNTKIICQIDCNIERQCKSGFFRKNKQSNQVIKNMNKKIINYCKGNKNYYLSYINQILNGK